MGSGELYACMVSHVRAGEGEGSRKLEVALRHGGGLLRVLWLEGSFQLYVICVPLFLVQVGQNCRLLNWRIAPAWGRTPSLSGLYGRDGRGKEGG